MKWPRAFASSIMIARWRLWRKSKPTAAKRSSAWAGSSPMPTTRKPNSRYSSRIHGSHTGWAACSPIRLNIARDWRLRKITAETAPSNGRMLAIFRGRGFELDGSRAADVVLARKELEV